MAEKRMFAKTIIDSDAFLDMPLSTQALYFHLSMRADDDGFINNPKKIQRIVGASDDDLKLLIAKSFIIAFESGVMVIKHWRMHNYIQKDRYKPTVYREEASLIGIKENKAYTLLETECIQNVYSVETQSRLDKSRLVLEENNNICASKTDAHIPEPEPTEEIIDPAPEPSQQETKKKRFKPPTHEEVQAYCKERNNNVDAYRFIDYYSSNGWKVGRNPMKDWKAAVRTWERSSSGYSNNRPTQQYAPRSVIPVNNTTQQQLKALEERQQQALESESFEADYKRLIEDGEIM